MYEALPEDQRSKVRSLLLRRAAFPEFELQCEHGVTLFRAEFVDRAALHGVIERVAARSASTSSTCDSSWTAAREVPSADNAPLGTFGPNQVTFTRSGSSHRDPVEMFRGRARRSPVGGSDKEFVMLAYDFPLLGVFWSLFMFALFTLWIFTVIWCFVDNFRRRDHHGLAKALWFLFIVFVPIIGVVAYIITRPVDPL